MGEGAWLVGFLVAQRLAELGIAQWNTQRLRAAGGVEFGATHYLLMVALHSFWLFGLWILGHGRAVDPFWLAVFVVLQGGRLWVIMMSRAAMDHARDRAARHGDGCARALSLAQAPELPDRGAGGCGGSTGARPAGVRARLHARQRGAVEPPYPRGESGPGLGRRKPRHRRRFRRQPLPMDIQNVS